MTLMIDPASNHAKLIAEQEQHHTDFTIGGLKPGNPYVYRPFPAMMYRAGHLPSGKWAVAMDQPAYFGFRDMNEWDRAVVQAAAFNTSCQRIVKNEAERDRARDEGWRDNPTEAMEHRHALDKEIGDAAAARNFTDRNMGDRAKAESDAIQADTFGHMPEIPSKPVKRRGRPRKVRAAAPAV